MKGIEIAREFFFGWGEPFLRKEFPELADRMAAARLRGSEVLGGDDEISRDHSWGPSFELFLSAEDYATYGDRLSRTMNIEAPNPWNGYRLALGQSVIVESIPEWFRKYVHFSHLPQTADDWAEAEESFLYFLHHGTVWFDGSGELSTWRSALHQYPREVLRKRLAKECWRVWHHGEYNFVSRMARRREPLATAICLGEFISGVMRIVMLLGGDFTPYWKWLPFEFRKRPEAPEYLPLLDGLIASGRIEEQVPLVLRLCRLVHKRLVSDGWVTGQGEGPRGSLMNDWHELESHLRA